MAVLDSDELKLVKQMLDDSYALLEKAAQMKQPELDFNWDLLNEKQEAICQAYPKMMDLTSSIQVAICKYIWQTCVDKKLVP